MKKFSSIALGAAVMAGLSASAAAQSNVTIYGLIDTGIVRETGGAAGSVTKLTSGMSNGSRIGFKGTEGLGGGLSALFLLETGYQTDTGALGQGGLIFGRQAYVGLKSVELGTVTLGRQYTPEYNTLVLADPFQTGLAGDAANIMPNTGNSASRMDNAVMYASPIFAGFSGEAVYGAGETAGNTTAQSQWGGALAYSNGPLNARLGYHYRNNDTTTTRSSAGRNTLLAVTYNFGFLKAHLGYGIDQGVNSSIVRAATNTYGTGLPVSSTDSRDMLLGVTVPFGAVHTFLASVIRKDDKTALNQDATQYAVGYRYALSKRTDLYASYAHITNKNGAGYAVGSSIEAGTGNAAYSVGMRHTF